MNDLGQSLIWN